MKISLMVPEILEQSEANACDIDFHILVFERGKRRKNIVIIL